MIVVGFLQPQTAMPEPHKNLDRRFVLVRPEKKNAAIPRTSGQPNQQEDVAAYMSRVEAFTKAKKQEQKAAQRKRVAAPSASTLRALQSRFAGVKWSIWIFWVSLFAGFALVAASVAYGDGRLNLDYVVPSVLFFAFALILLFNMLLPVRSSSGHTSRSAARSGVDPRRVAAAATVFTAYKAQQIHKEIQEMREESSDFDDF